MTSTDDSHAARPARASTPPQPPALTARGQRTRRALLDAGRKVFERDGYHDARIADVAREAGCAVGSFYNYFESKEEFFKVLLIELEGEVYREPARLPSDAAPVDRLRETNRLYFESFRRNSAFWAVVEQAVLQSKEARQLVNDRHHYYRARTERALALWQANGLVSPDVNLRFAAAALGAMTERCAYLWFVLEEQVDFDEAVEEVTQLWARALQLK